MFFHIWITAVPFWETAIMNSLTESYNFKRDY